MKEGLLTIDELTALPDNRLLDVEMGANSPMVAHLKALVHVLRGEQIPTELEQIILDRANLKTDSLRCELEEWDVIISSYGRGTDLFAIYQQTEIGCLTNAMAKSFGDETSEAFYMRKECLERFLQNI